MANTKVTSAVIADGAITPSKIASGDFNFDTDTLYIDSTNNRVGIGTNSPVKTLQVSFNNSSTDIASSLAGGTAGSGVLIQNTNTTAGISANLDFRANNADARIAYKYNATNDGDFHFITDNSDSLSSQMVIKNAGNVGIGTDDPDTLLHLIGSNNQFRIGTDATHYWTQAVVYSYTNPDLIWIGDDGLTKMVLSADGNLGLGGIGNPSGLLHVDSGLAHNHIKFVTSQQSGTGYDVTLDVTGGANNSEMKVRMGTISNPSREQIVAYNGSLTLYNNGVARHNYYAGGHSAEQSVTNGIGYYNYVGWIDSTGTDYIHIKTNVSKSNWMMKFWYEGYIYSSHNVRSSITFYTYTGVNYVYIPSITQQSSNSSYTFTTPYYSSDNYVVLVIYHPSNYTGLNLWAQSNDDHGTKEVKVLGITGSANSTGVY